MKAILLVLTIALATNLYSQSSTNNKQMLLEKSKSQKTAGWILLAGGAALGVTGAVVFANSEFLSESDGNTDLGGFMMLGGSVAMLISIPMFISSANNARKAATLTIGTQKLLIPHAGKTALQLQPSIGLRINF